MDDTELMLEELAGLKDTVSRVYRDRLRNARGRRSEATTESEGDGMQLCPSCGEEIPDTSETCPKCGARVSAAEDTALVEQDRRRSRFDAGLARR